MDTDLNSEDIYIMASAAARTFDLKLKHPGFEHLTFTDATTVDDETSNRYLTTLSRLDSKASLVVGVDGVCQREGSTAALAAYGAYFGPDSIHNLSARVPQDGTHTLHAAGYYAVLETLKTVEKNEKNEFDGLTRVIISTHSKDIFMSFTKWLDIWMENKFKMANGNKLPREYYNLIWEVVKAIVRLDGKNIKVQFWLIPFQHNIEANYLAKVNFFME